jgi:hypothetical protein
LSSAQFVSDDDQLQAAVAVVPGEFILQDSKRFDEPVHVFVKSYTARIEHERFLDLIAFEDGGMILGRGW